MYRDISKIVTQMSLQEKAGMCSGKGYWHTKAVERLGVPGIMVADGPHGLRKQEGTEDHLGINTSKSATCFPSASCLACSWDRNLVESVGAAIGEEALKEGISIVLGPGANIKRSPLCGRNFEYFSEDPFLSSEMAASHIKGLQSRNTGASLKHFAVNNQEHRRMSVDVDIDERTLREIYLASFEGAITKAEPWTIMCAYNKVNGTYCSENRYLLTEVLRDEWGFKGFVMSDWGAVNSRVNGLLAGLELEMPSSNGVNDIKIVDAVQRGELPEAILNKAVERILGVIFKATDSQKKYMSCDMEAHHTLAKEAAQECMVLLKNEDRILPLQTQKRVSIIGDFIQNPRYQGSGSSRVNPVNLDCIYSELENAAGDGFLTYSRGYIADSKEIDEILMKQAAEAASKAETAVIFAGLPFGYEKEGYDRTHLSMPENQIKLIEKVAEVQQNVVVVLCNGAPVEMPWIKKAKGVLEAYLSGQALGSAITGLLFGDVNPCGKLAETFPMKLAHNPSFINFPGEGDRVEYREGLFVGYRYYDMSEIKPLFPFGYGLSYTTYEYTGISIDKKEICDTEAITVKVRIRNTGNMRGKEIVQLYVRDEECSVIRPVKELKGFEKVELNPGEEKTVSFILEKRAFAYYNVDVRDWHVESGYFNILVGSSSEDIHLKESVYVKSTVQIRKVFTRDTPLQDFKKYPDSLVIYQQIIKGMNMSAHFEAVGMDAISVYDGMPLHLIALVCGFNDENLESMLVELNHKQKITYD